MSNSQESLGQYFTSQHREADELWAVVELAVQRRDAALRAESFGRFERSILQHLALEEEVLFPEFEQATGMTQGPTTVMRAEHKNIRALLAEMKAAAAGEDYDLFMDTADTLLTLVSQHNMKEEAMLYRMAEHALDAAWPQLRERAKAYA